jgi:hypothetical protein
MAVATTPLTNKFPRLLFIRILKIILPKYIANKNQIAPIALIVNDLSQNGFKFVPLP